MAVPTAQLRLQQHRTESKSLPPQRSQSAPSLHTLEGHWALLRLQTLGRPLVCRVSVNASSKEMLSCLPMGELAGLPAGAHARTWAVWATAGCAGVCGPNGPSHLRKEGKSQIQSEPQRKSRAEAEEPGCFPDRLQATDRDRAVGGGGDTRHLRGRFTARWAASLPGVCGSSSQRPGGSTTVTSHGHSPHGLPVFPADSACTP